MTHTHNPIVFAVVGNQIKALFLVRSGRQAAWQNDNLETRSHKHIHYYNGGKSICVCIFQINPELSCAVGAFGRTWIKIAFRQEIFSTLNVAFRGRNGGEVVYRSNAFIWNFQWLRLRKDTAQGFLRSRRLNWEVNKKEQRESTIRTHDGCFWLLAFETYSGLPVINRKTLIIIITQFARWWWIYLSWFLCSRNSTTKTRIGLVVDV